MRQVYKEYSSARGGKERKKLSGGPRRSNYVVESRYCFARVRRYHRHIEYVSIYIYNTEYTYNCSTCVIAMQLRITLNVVALARRVIPHKRSKVAWERTWLPSGPDYRPGV